MFINPKYIHIGLFVKGPISYAWEKNLSQKALSCLSILCFVTRATTVSKILFFIKLFNSFWSFPAGFWSSWTAWWSPKHKLLPWGSFSDTSQSLWPNKIHLLWLCSGRCRKCYSKLYRKAVVHSPPNGFKKATTLGENWIFPVFVYHSKNSVTIAISFAFCDSVNSCLLLIWKIAKPIEGLRVCILLTQTLCPISAGLVQDIVVLEPRWISHHHHLPHQPPPFLPPCELQNYGRSEGFSSLAQ